MCGAPSDFFGWYGFIFDAQDPPSGDVFEPATPPEMIHHPQGGVQTPPEMIHHLQGG
jgi:hypothetical protein